MTVAVQAAVLPVGKFDYRPIVSLSLRPFFLAVAGLGACQFTAPTDVGVRVGGAVTGLWHGAELVLELQAGERGQTVTVEGDGAFAFPIDVATGQSFVVTARPVAQHQCRVIDGSGVADATTLAAVHVVCDGPALAIDVSVPTTWRFDPATSVQPLPVRALAGSLTIRARHPELTGMLVNGAALAPGVWSTPIALSGPSTTVTLEAQVGALSRTYTLDVQRDLTAIAPSLYAKSSVSAAGDMLGTAVAISGDTMVAAAPFHDGKFPDDGATFVFERVDGAWMEVATLLPQGGRQPFAAAIDGDLIVIGVPGHRCTLGGPRPICEGNSVVDVGAAFVFRRSPAGDWQQEVILKAAVPRGGDRFGYAVAVADGVVVVGAPNEDSAAIGVDGSPTPATATDAGAAYVFIKDAGGWRQDAYLKASNTDPGDLFGSAVALAGGTVVVGALSEASSSTAAAPDPTDNARVGAGAAYVFESTPTWHQTAYLKGDATAYRFGQAVALDGARIAVGSPQAGANTGLVYVYQREASTWTYAGALIAEDADDEDWFGLSVSVADDIIVVGAPNEGSLSSGVNPPVRDDTSDAIGAVYVFQRGTTAWNQLAYLKPQHSDPMDSFGMSVDLVPGRLCLGAPYESSGERGIGGTGQDDSALNAGALFCFE
ncbi:MAG: FG-GAP repeat protein [Kofleriaceae bacterium]